MNLRKKLISFSTLVMLGLSTISLFSVYWIVEKQLRKDIFDATTTSLTHAFEEIGQFRSERIREILGQADLVRDLYLTDPKLAEEQLQRLQQRDSTYLSLAVFSPEGLKLLDSQKGRLATKSDDFANLEFPGGNRVLVRYLKSPGSHEGYFAVVAPMRKAGRNIGYLAGFLSSDRMLLNHLENFKAFGERDGPEPVDFKIFQNETGEILVESSPASILYDRSQMQEISRNWPKNEKHETVYVQELDENFVFLGESQADEQGDRPLWQIIVRKSKGQIYGVLNRVIGSMVIFSILILLIFVGGLLWTYSKVFSPVMDISEKLVRFGQGDYEVFDSDLKGDAEFSIMTKNLKNMAHEIRQIMVNLGRESRLSAIGQMAGSIAHEINNPLAIITMRADILGQMLEKKKVTPEEIKEGLDKITATAQRISKIIHGLRALSGGENHEPFSEVYIKTIVDSTKDLCLQSLMQREIKLVTKTLTDDLRFECRPVQISQVLLNLINNAMDEIKDLEFKDRWIEVRAEGENDQVVIRVLNGGPKISEGLAKQMFQPFFTTKPPGQGTGLGLSISRQIVSSHRGEIHVNLSMENTCIELIFPKYQGLGPGALVRS